MKRQEVNPIPEECKNCTEEDCYNCDTAGKRWVLSREEELRTNRKLMEQATRRFQRKIGEMDAELERLRRK